KGVEVSATDFLELFPAPADQGQLRPLGGERAGDGGADPGAAAGDQSVVTLQAHERSPVIPSPSQSWHFGPSLGWTAPRAVQAMPGAWPTPNSLPWRERGEATGTKALSHLGIAAAGS